MMHRIRARTPRPSSVGALISGTRGGREVEGVEERGAHESLPFN